METALSLVRDVFRMVVGPLQGNRIVWVDCARAIAILMVIVCHSTESIYSLSLEGISGIAVTSRVVAFTLFTIGRLGVPLFLFISGFLMLDRWYDREACLKFWKKKWLGLVIATESWIVVYNLFLCLVDGVPFDLARLVRNMLFLENVGMGHMWYMPMILGLYLFLPFIANGLRWLNDARLLRAPLLVALCVLFFVPVANIISQSFGLGSLSCEIAPGFSGGAYGCYMLLGYCVKKNCTPSKTPLLWMLGAVAFAATVALQVFAYSRGVFAPVWYSNGLLLVAAFCLFLAISQFGRWGG